MPSDSHSCTILGLSPHTRGNRDQRRETDFGPRSIPAHTGEPDEAAVPGIGTGVYPRTHGGTPEKPVPAVALEGLSPHTRGNLSALPGPPGFLGSIPAHTGEPPAPLLSPQRRRVYPRTHGGTVVMVVGLLRWSGLSPHTRGNPWIQARAQSRPGSIPAHTGEPKTAQSCRIAQRSIPAHTGEPAGPGDHKI